MNNNGLRNDNRNELSTTNSRFYVAMWIYAILLIIFLVYSFKNDFFNFFSDNFANEYVDQEDSFDDEIYNYLYLYEHSIDGLKIFSKEKKSDVQNTKVHSIKCESYNCFFMNFNNEDYIINDLFVVVKDGVKVKIYDTKRRRFVESFVSEDNVAIFIQHLDNSIDMDYFIVKDSGSLKIFDVVRNKVLEEVSFDDVVFDIFSEFLSGSEFVSALSNSVILVEKNGKYRGINYHTGEELFSSANEVVCNRGFSVSHCDLNNENKYEILSISEDKILFKKNLDKIYYSDGEIVLGKNDKTLILYNKNSFMEIDTSIDVSNYMYLNSIFKENKLYLNFVKDFSIGNSLCNVYVYDFSNETIEKLDGDTCIRERI